MVRVLNAPDDFADEMLAGFAAAYARFVRPVFGGVVRSGAVTPGQVAIVVGGGSGHYPAFAGLVGPGLAHGAAMGNVFASPSCPQVLSVAREVECGGGVLLLYGNYMGDVLNFTQAQDQLRASGIETRTVVVTDDIASAGPEDIELRRGIAGDLVVFKIAGAAAAAGSGLAEVAELAARANAMTRTLGVAFGGCSLPGADEPLFEVPDGSMAVGMGIHGEPGLGVAPLPDADTLAELLVTRVLAESPSVSGPTATGRVAVVLNGLGGVKYEELFVLYGGVARRLAAAGLVPVEPEVGELVTSFDMAGVSLTLTWLDDTLESLWVAPASTPAFRRGAGTALGVSDVSDAAEPTALTRPSERPDDVTAVVTSPDVASAESRRAAAVVVDLLAEAAVAIEASVEELGRLDAIAGDGDHGLGMQRGIQAGLSAAREAASRDAGAGSTLVAAADGWASRAGGTSGAIWGLILRALGTQIGDDDLPSLRTLSAGADAAVGEVARFGRAEEGDKTLLDVLAPVARAVREAQAQGRPWREALVETAATAESRAAATADLVPRIGRARPHAERSLGSPDPGAVSMATAIRAVSNYFEQEVTSR